MAESRGRYNLVTSITADDSDCDVLRGPSPKKPKIYKQKYNSQWEKHSELKGWIAPVRKDPYKAFCNTCGKELTAGLSELRKHHSSKKHQELANAVKTTRPITEMVSIDTTVEMVKRAEIKMAAFVVEHHLPFQAMDHLSDIVTDIFPHRTKV